jgi:trigger factor
MKSTVDKLDGLSRKLNIEIPAEKVHQAFDRVYKAIQKKANIKGFRQGKAPMNVIKSMYGDQVKSDVVNDLINEGYQAALDEHKLEPVGYPKVSFENIDEQKVFNFSAEFEIRPEIHVKSYEGLTVEKEKLEIPEERVSTILENLRSQQTDYSTVFEDRAVTDGDVAVVDFKGIVGGEPLPNGTAEDHHLEIGSKQFIEGFEEGVVGMKIGENRTLNLRFPEGYHEASLSGAPVQFDVTLKGIKKKVLPELNDELAKKLGDFENREALKTRIREDLKEGEQQRIADDLKNRVVKALVAANPIEAPKSLVAQQKEALIEDFKGRMKQQGLGDKDFEEYKAKWDRDFEESATFMVKSTFLLDELAHKLGLGATESDIEAKMQEYAKQTGIEMSRLKEFYGKPERRSRLSFQITQDKVVQLLVDKAQIKEVPRDQLPKEEEA